MLNGQVTADAGVSLRAECPQLHSAPGATSQAPNQAGSLEPGAPWRSFSRTYGQSVGLGIVKCPSCLVRKL